MEDSYLNDFHRQHSEKLKEHMSGQPKASLEDAMKQYGRIKEGVRGGNPNSGLQSGFLRSTSIVSQPGAPESEVNQPDWGSC